MSRDSCVRRDYRKPKPDLGLCNKQSHRHMNINEENKNDNRMCFVSNEGITILANNGRNHRNVELRGSEMWDKVKSIKSFGEI